jgi:hypothetical protein
MDSEIGALEKHKSEAERAALSAWTKAWSDGQAMSLDQAIAEAQELLTSESDSSVGASA